MHRCMDEHLDVIVQNSGFMTKHVGYRIRCSELWIWSRVQEEYSALQRFRIQHKWMNCYEIWVCVN